jgi:hypothetical protein
LVALVREGAGVGRADRDDLSAMELAGRHRLGMTGYRVSGWMP